MTAANWKIRIDAGASFRTGIKILDESGNPVILTGYAARLQIREYPLAPDPPLAEWSTSNGVITVDPAGRRFVITVPPAVTATYVWWRHGVYDMLVTTPDGTVDKLLEGEAEVQIGVTAQ